MRGHFWHRVLNSLGPRIKPVLYRYWLIRRGMTLGVRIALFDDRGRICLVRHTYVPGWYFPGGGVEPGETAEQAVKKELREEANIDLDGPLELFGIFRNAKAFSRDHVVLFVRRGWCGEHKPRPSAEIAECGFFELERLPADTTRATRARLAEINGPKNTGISDGIW